MPEQNVIFTEDRALQGYSSVVTCAIDGQGFHNGNMERGPEGEGRLDRNSQIFFSAILWTARHCGTVSRGIKEQWEEAFWSDRAKNLIDFSTRVYVNKNASFS
ncbi:uncharacterized protein LOC115988370 [Quercus lobata]|uniref:uncharacterized protein LOC115988370 n=1 Tax=Quercus lobata TaxID=97700 RepID=UPI0012484CFA|nr:uncharacterized protein LOC115988370 [Quercus lobata]XP_030967867.1 uncharacterized protein LOC115988370 [Quercus lobata]